ncbi:enoyl-CoA hydratase-related protein [Amycolatopsis sp. NBC_01488]|uniref:enoyl-CoA hydratase-related protein n=1 Tax=Amycolatopsis sp. NBC_01488 TaxID=2903563 RepID=UPI002E27D00C|nr:enoyl-CoA hydratase-related protein [Amycolatopsis sp. NBC_01488]
MLDLDYRRDAIVVRIRTATPGVLDAAVLDGLAAAITYIGPGRPIILTGDGDVFAPDVDPAPGPARTDAQNRLRNVVSALRSHPLPVVAAINGDAIGAGYALAEAAGVRIMSGGAVEPSSRRARRFPARAAVAAGLVELHCSPGHLIDLALRLAAHQQPALAG